MNEGNIASELIGNGVASSATSHVFEEEVQQ